MSGHQQQRGPAWLDDYVSVEERLATFRAKHPTARIVTQRLEGEPLTFRAEIYLEDNLTLIPNAVGHASVDGGSGNRKQSPTEKTETAAIGRALTVMGVEGGEEQEAPPKTKPPINVKTAPGVPPVRAVPPDSQPARPPIANISEIQDPFAADELDAITEPQKTRIRQEAERVEVDAEQECQRVFRCRISVGQLSRAAAASFIKHLKDGAPDRPA